MSTRREVAESRPSPPRASVAAHPTGPMLVVLRVLVVIAGAALYGQLILPFFGTLSTLHPNHPPGPHAVHEVLVFVAGGVDLLTVLAAAAARGRRETLIATALFALVMLTQVVLVGAARTSYAVTLLNAFLSFGALGLTGLLVATLCVRPAPAR